METRRLPSTTVLIFWLVVASSLCAATVEYRIRHSHDDSYRFLDWNLFLAWVPLAFALVARAASDRRYGLATVPLGVLWLLFFPNAPYLLTDFIHLHQSPTAPLWYDGLMISSFAWTGLLLGFVSLYLMQGIWRRRTGDLLAWVCVVAVLALASIGVYIGRYVGYNSWDALLHPGQVGHLLKTRFDANPLRDARREGSLAVLTGFLTVAYAVFSSAAGLYQATRARQHTS